MEILNISCNPLEQNEFVDWAANSPLHSHEHLTDPQPLKEEKTMTYVEYNTGNACITFLLFTLTTRKSGTTTELISMNR